MRKTKNSCRYLFVVSGHLLLSLFPESERLCFCFDLLLTLFCEVMLKFSAMFGTGLVGSFMISFYCCTHSMIG